jgi:hypothetical protein
MRSDTAAVHTTLFITTAILAVVVRTMVAGLLFVADQPRRRRGITKKGA